jgi:hypothetical protein
MKVILQSVDEFQKMGIFDLSSGDLEVFLKQTMLSEETNGVFSDTAHGVVCFFRTEQRLAIAFEKKLFILEDDDQILIEHTDQEHSQFKVLRKTDTILSLTYKPPHINPSLNAYQFFGPVEEEDFDIFLLIRNVYNDLERRHRVFRPRSFYRNPKDKG